MGAGFDAQKMFSAQNEGYQKVVSGYAICGNQSGLQNDIERI